MTTANYNEMTGAELLAVYNSMVHEEAKQLHVWKHAKGKLIDRIYAMQRARSVFEQVGAPEPFKEALVDTAEAIDVPQKVAKKARAMSKSMKLLDLLLDVEGNVAELEFVVSDLETTEGSVRSYVSYFRTGKKGHPIIALQVTHGLVMFVDDAAKAKAVKVMDDLRATFNK